MNDAWGLVRKDRGGEKDDGGEKEGRRRHMLQQTRPDKGVDDIIRAYNVRHRDVRMAPEIRTSCIASHAW